MELLTELLNLNENIGNLRKVHSHLVKMFTNAFNGTSADSKLKTPFGPGSKIETEPVNLKPNKVPDFLLDKIKVDRNATAPYPIATILVSNGEQLIAFGYQNRLDGSKLAYDQTSTLLALATTQLFDHIHDEDFKTATKNKISKSQIVGSHIAMNVSTAKSIIKLVADAAVGNGYELKAMFVYADPSRAATGAERAKERSLDLPDAGAKADVINRELDLIRRKGSVNGVSYFDTPRYKELTAKLKQYDQRINTSANLHRKSPTSATQYNHAIESIQNQFKQRLETYKASKAISTGSPEELITVLIDKGYLDKVKVAGYTYKYYGESFNFRALRAKSKSTYDQSYIEYEIDRSSAEFKKYEKDREEARAAAVEKAKSEAGGDSTKYNELLDKYYYSSFPRPTGKIRLILGLKGGAIIPVEIAPLEKDAFW